jgi:hypothetical protein
MPALSNASVLLEDCGGNNHRNENQRIGEKYRDHC